MKTFCSNFVGKSRLLLLFVALACVLTFSTSGFGQRILSKTDSIAFAPAAPPNFDQCENGTGQGTTCNWVNGNLNSNNSSYIEGQSVAYRVKFSDLTVGSTNNSITIEYDSLDGGLHSLDYLTTFNRSVTNADPCIGITGCNLAVFDTEPIPIDSAVTRGQDGIAGTSDDITQIPGVFTLFGGTITAVSGYSFSSNNNAIQTRITVTFTANVNNPVLAWGGHIATRGDWGIGNTVVSGNGSDYHMRNGGAGGQQDLPLQVSAVIFPAKVTIIKEVTLFNNGGTASTQAFPFTATNFGTANFSLVDNNVVGPDRIVNSNITAFGNSNIITVTESQVLGWSLSDPPVCTEDPGGLPQTDNSVTGLGTPNATLTVEEGEIITCTFKNLQVAPSAASAFVSGRVLTETGLPLRRAAVTIFNAGTLETQTVYTNQLGYYRFDNLTVNNFYIVTVAHGKRAFFNNTQSFTLNDNLTDVNFYTPY
jgi:hypothetical protein